MTKSAAVADVTDPRGRLEFLERRRLEIDATLWQIPGLTVAGQAFLLQVLVSDNTSHMTDWLAAAAGIFATAATGLALGHQVAREHRHSDAVTKLAEAEGLGFTGTGEQFWGKGSGFAEVRAWAMWIAFLLVLVALAAADALALAENLSR